MGNILQRNAGIDSDVVTPALPKSLTPAEVEIIKATWKIPSANVSAEMYIKSKLFVFICASDRRSIRPSSFSTLSSNAFPRTSRNSRPSKTFRSPIWKWVSICLNYNKNDDSIVSSKGNPAVSSSCFKNLQHIQRSNWCPRQRFGDEGNQTHYCWRWILIAFESENFFSRTLCASLLSRKISCEEESHQKVAKRFARRSCGDTHRCLQTWWRR